MLFRSIRVFLHELIDPRIWVWGLGPTAMRLLRK